MQRIKFLLIILILFLAASSIQASERIVALHPALTENLFALGLGSSIVGTTEYSNYPEEAKSIPRVGDNHFSTEKILSLKPTHILSITENFGVPEAILKRLNIKTLRLRLEGLDDFEPALEKMGEMFQKKPEAKKLLREWKEEWKTLPSPNRNLRVMIQVQVQPIVVVGKATFLGEILNKCGVKNSVNYNGYPSLNRETLTKLHPDLIILLLTDADKAARQSTEKMWAELSSETRIKYFEPSTISKIAPRLPHEARKFCGLFNNPNDSTSERK